jgi:ubiquinone/menaquinone biosynthesis C-methylase UbiE
MAGDPLQPAAVRAAYDRRARWYDRLVLALSAGLDGVYRRAAVRALGGGAGAPGDPAATGVVLEIGCGTGLNLRLLRDRQGPAVRMVACDASRGMLAVAREPARRARAHLVRADGGRLPLRTGAASALLSTYTVTTVPDPEGAAREMARCVRPGGRIVLTDDRLPPGWFLGPLAMLRGLRARGWRDSLPAMRRVLGAACRGRLVSRLWHAGLIWLLAGTRR